MLFSFWQTCYGALPVPSGLPAGLYQETNGSDSGLDFGECREFGLDLCVCLCVFCVCEGVGGTGRCF